MGIESKLRQRRAPVVAAFSVASILAIYLALTWWSTEFWRDASFGRKADSVHWRLSVASASTALLLLATALSMGPVRRLRSSGLDGPVHLPWRRTIGVAGALVGWFHAALGVTIHSAGWKIWVPFTHFASSSRLLAIFSVAMTLGLITALALIPIAVTSSSGMLRRLRAQRWKQVQRLSYFAFATLIAHVVSIQYQERRALLHISITMAVILVVVLLQSAGVMITRSRLKTLVLAQRSEAVHSKN